MLLLCCLCLQLTEQRALPHTSTKTKKGTANNATRSNTEQHEVKTSRREICQSMPKYKVQQCKPGTYASNESDSNADTCCLGSNFCILSYTNRTADVYPYDTSYEPLHNVPIVTGATAWTCLNTDETYILVFNELLYYGKRLSHSLINPNQVRNKGLGYWERKSEI